MLKHRLHIFYVIVVLVLVINGTSSITLIMIKVPCLFVCSAFTPESEIWNVDRSRQTEILNQNRTFLLGYVAVG